VPAVICSGPEAAVVFCIIGALGQVNHHLKCQQPFISWFVSDRHFCDL